MKATYGDGSTPAGTEVDGSSGVAAEISNRVVGLLKEYSGRGPTKARTYIGGDVIVCVIEDALTRGEKKMAEGGEEDQAIATRRTYQRLIREDARQAIEELTGRQVLAFLSDSVTEPDVGIEAFVLKPQAAEAGRS